MKALLAGLLILLAGCTPAAVPTPAATPTVVSKPAAIIPTATAVPSPTAAPSTVSICNTGGLGAYLRAEPKGSGIVAWPEGTKLTVMGPDRNVEGEVWRNVQDEKGTTGWTKTDYLCPSP